MGLIIVSFRARSGYFMGRVGDGARLVWGTIIILRTPFRERLMREGCKADSNKAFHVNMRHADHRWFLP